MVINHRLLGMDWQRSTAAVRNIVWLSDSSAWPQCSMLRVISTGEIKAPGKDICALSMSLPVRMMSTIIFRYYPSLDSGGFMQHKKMEHMWREWMSYPVLNELYNVYHIRETQIKTKAVFPEVAYFSFLRWWQSSKDVRNYSTSRSGRTWRILAQVITGDLYCFSQRAPHGRR